MTTQVRAQSTNAGAVIGPESDVSGLGGIFSKLMDEHGEATRLILRLLDTEGLEAQAQLYPTLRTALLAHERTEASVLYATLRQYAATRALAEDHAREARELEDAIHSLDALSLGSDTWKSQLRALSALVRAHAQREEAEIFPAALQALGTTTTHDLRDAYLRTKLGIVNTIEADSQAIASAAKL